MQCPGCKGIPLNYEKLNIIKDNDENKISEENHKQKKTRKKMSKLM